MNAASSSARPRLGGNRSRLVLFYAASAVILVWSFGPIVWMALASVVPQGDFTQGIDLGRVDRWNLDSYGSVLGDSTFLSALLNSVIVSVGTTLLCLTICALAGYSLARLEPQGGALLAYVLLASRMVPAIVMLIPLYLLMSRYLHLNDSYVGLILVQTALLCPYAVWMLRSFFSEVPRSVEFAARVDGCSRLGVLRRVTLPMSAQGILATGVFIFINTWNEFMLPLILSGSATKTVTVKLAQLSSVPGGFFQFGPVMAAAIVTILPPIVFFLVARKPLVRGVTAGGVKS